MSLKSLDNLAGLQVPHIDEVVLRAADNPFAAGHREVGEDAVLGVGVALVGLERFALVEVPQLEVTAMRGRGKRGYGMRISVGAWSICMLLFTEYLSMVAAKMYLPLGENLTKETGGFSLSENGINQLPKSSL
jgi:hypothetical protein